MLICDFLVEKVIGKLFNMLFFLVVKWEWKCLLREVGIGWDIIYIKYLV